MTDKKTSLLVPSQLPGFIREDYPKFISFLEAYYEFLEQERFTNGSSQKNDLITKSKDMRYLSDVDYSLDSFEEQFFNSFLPFIPRTTAINKDLLIKNIMPVLLSKGSEKSYKLLFRMLFDTDLAITYPKDNILKASDGRWIIENILRLTTTVYSEYTGDGETTTYYLPEIYEPSEVTVFVDGVLITTGYELRKEYRKVIFDEALLDGQDLKIYYSNFSPDLMVNRQFTGKTSGATTLVESSGIKTLGGSNFYEFFINQRTTNGIFLDGELVNAILVDVDNNEIPLTFQTYSDVEKIVVVDGGSSYNIGDPVIIRGSAIEDAAAVVDSVTSGVIEEVQVLKGGHGYQTNNSVIAVGYGTNVFSAIIESVDTSGNVSANTISFNTDIITDYLNVTINSANYGFPGAISENVNTVIAQALTTNTITVGPITSINVTTSFLSSLVTPTLDAISSNVGNTGFRIKDLGIIADLNIVSGGEDYQLGDTIVFSTYGGLYPGYGANAYVSNVDANGAITDVTIRDGGLLYQSGNFPPLTISSSNGTNAIINVASIMGDGEELRALVSGIIAGRILSIRILDSGVGYANVPGVDLTQSGDGTATAYANIRNTVVTLPGRWSTSDGLISSTENVLQGRDYYIDFSYVLSSRIQFNEYKSLLKNLLHPAGLVNYAIYEIPSTVESNVSLTATRLPVEKQPSGVVNISNNSIIVLGSNTAFLNLNTSGVLVVGDTVVINNQSRNVVSINSQTTFNVDNVFTTTSNNQSIKIVV